MYKHHDSLISALGKTIPDINTDDLHYVNTDDQTIIQMSASLGKSYDADKINQIKTKFYVRFMVTDKPGILSSITGILGKHNISINSVTQNAHNPTSTVPIIMLTDYTSEKMLRLALNKIQKLPLVKSKPVAIRMEKLW